MGGPDSWTVVPKVVLACVGPLEEKEKQEGLKEVFIFRDPDSFAMELCSTGRFPFSIN